MLLEHEMQPQLNEIGILHIWSRTPHGARPSATDDVKYLRETWRIW